MTSEGVILIIQSRMGSIRLPGKSTFDLAGKPLISRILERVKRCKTFDEIVLAIPHGEQDDILENQGKLNNIKVFRGSEHDLLDRYYQSAKFYNAKYVARLPADNPVPEPKEIDKLINFHLSLGTRGFSSNLAPFFNSGYPDGIGIEVFDFSLLEEAYHRNKDFLKREHVHLNFFDYKNEKVVDQNWCQVNTIKCPKEFSRPDLILDVNTREQYLFMKELYEYLYPKDSEFGILEIIDWYDNVYSKNNKKI